ncbi:hypothetical protein BH09VER1_BH09VER1_20780 [soil metagenome]
MSDLKCGQCGHENDSTRVFCQNCGARLERAEGSQATIAAPTQVPTERPAITRKKKEGQTKSSGKLVGFLVSVLITIVLSAGFAAAIQMSRQPEAIPPMKPGNEAQATALYQYLKTFADSTFPRTYAVKQNDANNYLACRLVSATAEGDAASSVKAKFVRAFVVMLDGKLRYYVEEEFLGQSLFLYLEYEPALVNKAVVLKEIGGGIGHMKFNEYTLPMLDRLIGPVAKSALDVTDVVQNLNGLDLKVGEAMLRWSGSPKSQGQ